jgi:hypothetical protein
MDEMTLNQLEAYADAGEKKIKGSWWTNQDIPIVEIEGVLYALNEFNGEVWTECWKVLDTFTYDPNDQHTYTIRPIYACHMIPNFWETYDDVEENSHEWDTAWAVVNYEVIY